ncbi:GBS Bsp-like repeat-containing protein, partial [Streptococcus pyogenes]
MAKNFVQDQEQLAIEVKTDKQENYIFEKLAYEWPAQEVTSTELSQTTLASITSSEASVATSSSEITSGSNSEIRSQETTTPKEVREAASPSVSLTAQEANGKFDVLASNLSRPSDITAVRVAIWSEKNGQDDLKWYPMPL